LVDELFYVIDEIEEKSEGELMNIYTPIDAWLVIKTKPRAEKKLYEQLTKAGYESFLPTYVVIRQWSDRKKKVEPSIDFWCGVRKE
jgi:hypothetical protein